MELKRCVKCKKEKIVSDFYKDKRAKDGLYTYCKRCHLSYSSRRVNRFGKRIIKRKVLNEEQRNEAKKKYVKEWWRKNKERLNAYKRRYFHEKRKHNPMFRLNMNVSNAVRFSLKGKKNSRKWQSLLGYKIEDLVSHLEKQFDDKMSWENYANYWEIDHRVPISWFKYEVAEDPEFKKCWALENLRPLEKTANRLKGNRFSNPATT